MVSAHSFGKSETRPRVVASLVALSGTFLSRSTRLLAPLIILVLFVVPANAELRLSGGSFVYEQVSTSSPYPIGQLQFSSSSPQYVCAAGDKETLSVGYGGSSCWIVSAWFGGKNYMIIDGETVKLNDFLSVTYSGGGKISLHSAANDEWKNTFRFKWDDPQVINITAEESRVAAILGSDKSVGIIVNNTFTTFPGSFLIVSSQELTGQTVSDEVQALIASQDLPVNTSVLGETQLLIYAKIKVGGAEFTESNPTVLYLNVLPSFQTVSSTSTTCYSDSDCKEGFSCKEYAYDSSTVKLCTKTRDENIRTTNNFAFIKVIGVIAAICVGLFLLSKVMRRG